MCDNYRGIILLSHSGKVYTRILEKRSRASVESLVNDSQHVCPGRGTTDAIFVVKMLLETSWKWGIYKYAMFTDLEKAFDRMDREHLWQILQDQYYNIPTKLVRTIRSMYANTTSKVRTQVIESDWFKIQSGVRQGGVLSPLMFITFMDKCVSDIAPGTYGEETVMYASDVAVIEDPITDIQEVANRWWFRMKANGMKVKTKRRE